MSNCKCGSCEYGYTQGEWSKQRCELEKDNKNILILGANGNCPYYTLQKWYEPGY